MIHMNRQERRRFLRFAGVAMLVVLALSVTGHFWHHLTDRACESPDQGFPHPCAQCSAFHGGVLAEERARTASPHLSPVACVVVLEDADRVADLHGDGSPRAPPLA